MVIQLRRYRIKMGRLDQFVTEWRAGVLPLRERFGFSILSAWTIPDRSEFVWILEHPDFASADQAYYESGDRRGLDPDPAVHIEEAIEAEAERVL